MNNYYLDLLDAFDKLYELNKKTRFVRQLT